MITVLIIDKDKNTIMIDLLEENKEYTLKELGLDE